MSKHQAHDTLWFFIVIIQSSFSKVYKNCYGITYLINSNQINYVSKGNVKWLIFHNNQTLSRDTIEVNKLSALKSDKINKR